MIFAWHSIQKILMAFTMTGYYGSLDKIVTILTR